MIQPNIEQLIQASLAASHRAYAPYSNFKVGAALLTASAEIFLGCNVENASYGLTICAERVAVTTAIAAGQSEFLALAIASQQAATPCGACRQVLSEFTADLRILLVDTLSEKLIREVTLKQLLPDSFRLLD